MNFDVIEGLTIQEVEELFQDSVKTGICYCVPKYQNSACRCIEYLTSNRQPSGDTRYCIILGTSPESDCKYRCYSACGNSNCYSSTNVSDNNQKWNCQPG